MPSLRSFIWLHSAIAIACAIVLSFKVIAVETQFLLLTLLYYAGVLIFSFYRKNYTWLKIYSDVLPLGIFQLLPVWVLLTYFKTVKLSTESLPLTGFVPFYVPFLWAIPLFMVIYVGNIVSAEFKTHPNKDFILNSLVAAISVIVFSIFEQVTWRLSFNVVPHVRMFRHVAVYVILSRVILGLITFNSYQFSKNKSIFAKIGGAFVIMVIYLGALLFFYSLIEKWIA